ncbi:uncharacterized protein EV420DRAFT_1671190 [Desarmillaria tabescens]|uniref:Glucose-methanol-choline oxidoreductase N-terminal domain-containing protein n=1 Tax=Armillaria tabescens TaxID=1929756 RepID=A0AA39N7R0_ARMTA|nr:uncharacterized protein EV420DRAFT_1671190 [Desarmillaria tabescens]KAK0460577.1 hypothetical protein EV420DRAFT_1671190 [Desarmillaria tabescens]
MNSANYFRTDLSSVFRTSYQKNKMSSFNWLPQELNDRRVLDFLDKDINFASLPGYPRGTDGHVILVTEELPREFPFNLDYNSEYQLGIGEGFVGEHQRSETEPGVALKRPILGLATMHILASSNLKEIILSAGSIGSPHILLNSGIGDSTEPSALGIQPVLHLPDMGKNLTDHPRYIINFFVNSTDTIENVYFRISRTQLLPCALYQDIRRRLTGPAFNLLYNDIIKPTIQNVYQWQKEREFHIGYWEL